MCRAGEGERRENCGGQIRRIRGQGYLTRMLCPICSAVRVDPGLRVVNASTVVPYFLDEPACRRSAPRSTAPRRRRSVSLRGRRRSRENELVVVAWWSGAVVDRPTVVVDRSRSSADQDHGISRQPGMRPERRTASVPTPARIHGCSLQRDCPPARVLRGLRCSALRQLSRRRGRRNPSRETFTVHSPVRW